MINDANSSINEFEEKIELNIFGAITGDGPENYFVVSAWSPEGSGFEEISSGIMAVTSSPRELSWKLIYTIETWIQSLYRFTPDCYMLGGIEGGLIKISQGKHEILNTGHVSGIYAIWGVNDQNCWLAHDEGLSHWDGKSITRDIKTEWISAIHSCHEKHAIAVGANGVVLHFDGNDWHEVDSVPTNERLTGVHCVSEREIYVCGWGGTLYRWDGQTYWEKIEVMHDGMVVDTPIYSPIKYMGNVYLGVGGGGLFKVNGMKALKIRNEHCTTTAVVNEKLIVTGTDLLVEFDGSEWRQVTIIPPHS